MITEETYTNNQYVSLRLKSITSKYPYVIFYLFVRRIIAAFQAETLPVA